MGYFMEKLGIKLTSIKEAEADGQDMNNPDDQPSDYNTEDAPAAEQPTDGETTDQNAENNVAEKPNEEPPVDGGEEPPMDYNDADMASGEGEGTDDGGEEPPPEEDTQPVNDIKQQEEEIYNNANMTPEQLDIKHKELKSQFLAMYDLTSSIIDRIGDASIDEENIAVVEFISENLSRLRTMLTDYIDSVYAGKSYIENAVTFNRFLATLNGINKMLEQLEKKEDK